MSNLQRAMMKSRLPPMCPNPRFPKPSDRGFRRQTDYNPIMWSEYFAEQKDVQTPQGRFRVYLSQKPENDGPLMVMLHGGGFSALSWAHFSHEITKLIHCQCLAFDIRGHGDTYTEDEEDLSAETLAQDVGDVVRSLYGESSTPPVILIGHSMGGAVCVHAANMRVLPSLIGVVVIDVVEGTALEALASMQSFLRSRPSTFKSIQHAVEWSVRSGQIRNVESARVSMPGQIINIETQKLATNELPLAEEGSSEEKSKFTNPNAIAEDAEAASPTESSSTISLPMSASSSSVFPVPISSKGPVNLQKYTWRINLSKSEKYWEGWFSGLSQKFLDIHVPKLLLLAGIDNLDRTLTVGQMQGKFQLQVLARCGHAVHEDRPHEVAEVIGTYLVRNRFAQASGDGQFLKHMPAC